MSKHLPLHRASRPVQWILASVFFALVLSLGCQKPAVQKAATNESQTEQALPQPTESQQVAEATNADDAKVEHEHPTESPVQSDSEEPKVELSKPSVLFDGKNLDYWEEIEFGGEGEVTIVEGILNFEDGDPFTGIASTLEDLPKTNFEVSLEARKVEGTDFFCGLTFPVADSHCTLILGGWGGGHCGLSCIDDKDASTNDTNIILKFNKGQWYKIRVRVEPERIGAWLDDKQIIDANIKGKRISLRGDTSLCEPLGIVSFETEAEYRKIELRTIKVNQDSEDASK